MNPDIRKNPRKRSVTTKDPALHKGYNEKNQLQTQGAFPPDSANGAPKNDIDNKAYKTEAEAKEKPNDNKVIGNS